MTVRLPKDWNAVSTVEVTRVEAERSILEKLTTQVAPKVQRRMVGFAVEIDGEERLLQIQVDLSSTGYRESPFLREGSIVELEAR